MKKIIIKARHTINGEEYSWLLPDELFENFWKAKRESEFHGLDIIALVENYDSVAIVDVGSYDIVEINEFLDIDHPFKKALNIWTGFAKNFIVGYESNIEADDANNEDVEDDEIVNEDENSESADGEFSDDFSEDDE